MSDQYTKDEDHALQASQAREILSLRSELTAARAESLSLRAGLAECQKLTSAQAEALADKADMIFSQAQTIDAQVQIIEAQRVNLDAARNSLKHIREMADEDIRDGTEGTMTWQIEADARAALGTEPAQERAP